MRQWLRSQLGLDAVAGGLPAPSTLRWVDDVLRGDSNRSGAEEPPESLRRFLPFPNLTHPRLLIPRGSKRSAGRAVLEFTDATSLRVRLERAALSAAIRTGALEAFWQGDVPGVGGKKSPPSCSPMALEKHVSEVFGRPTARFAVSLGPPRANIKPVLRVFDEEGHTLGYVKIGWNALTKELVRHEAHVLGTLHERELVNFKVPALIHAGAWRDLELVAVSAVPHAWRRGKVPQKVLPLAATKEVTSLGPKAMEPLATTRYWQSLKQRASHQRAASTSSQARTVLPGVIEYVEERYGHRPLSLGTWHGDWVPWNMRHIGDSLYVWDWERSDDCVPLGLDVVHFEFQVDVWLRRKKPVRALIDSIERSSRTLQQIVPEKGLTQLLATLSCIEMAIRMEQGAMASIPVPGRTYQALEDLFTALRELRPGVGSS
jgi:hypothetical protein